MKKTVGKFVRRKKAEKPRVTDAPETEHKVNHGASKELAEGDMLTDLDMLYMAMAEVDKVRHFNTFCYSLNITSLNTLLDYNSKDSTILDPAEIDIIKERIEHKYFNFKDLTKKYKQSKLVETCEIKNIPIIQKKDVAVTRNLKYGPYAGQEKVCLRYDEFKEHEFLHEAEMANVLRHKDILAFHGVVIASSYSPSLALVVEFAEYGSLLQPVQHHTVERLCKFTIQAATALEHVEKKKVIHQSVKSYNCLVVADHQEHPLKVRAISSFEASSDGFLSCRAGELITLIAKDRHRGDRNAWFGETKDRKIGFFKKDHVEEVHDENIDDWQRIEQKKLDVSEFVEDIARIIAIDLTETDVNQSNIEDVDSLLEQENGDEVDAGSPKKSDASPTSAKSTPDTKQENKTEIDDLSGSTLERSKPAYLDIQLSIDTNAVLPNDVTEMVIHYLQQLKLEDDIKAKEAI
ncbi:hypothetical protein OS493_037884 [Desmophyllum pertusum]|uniref:non-specific protein-tyrosine kinase n=1 Tax=Desmophyllum pertusum TaxID=174260 RepID=A0A9W9YHS8_9CNID|nr:hypothetical protein OS493_037884 [Desmophyllum pertusum]